MSKIAMEMEEWERIDANTKLYKESQSLGIEVQQRIDHIAQHMGELARVSIRENDEFRRLFKKVKEIAANHSYHDILDALEKGLKETDE